MNGVPHAVAVASPMPTGYFGTSSPAGGGTIPPTPIGAADAGGIAGPRWPWEYWLPVRDAAKALYLGVRSSGSR